MPGERAACGALALLLLAVGTHAHRSVSLTPSRAHRARVPLVRMKVTQNRNERRRSLADPRQQPAWLAPPSMLDRMATLLEETLADWPESPEQRVVGRELVQRTSVAIRTLESDWERFQEEVELDVEGRLKDLPPITARRRAASGGGGIVRSRRAGVGGGGGGGRALGGRRVGQPARAGRASPSAELRARQRLQVQAALRVLQREGWRGLEEVLTDSLPAEYHETVKEVLTRSREDGSAPNATEIRKVFVVASKDAQAKLRTRIAAAKEELDKRRERMTNATAEIKSDVQEIEREIESAYLTLKREWQESVATGELTSDGPETGATSYSELREFIERVFQRAGQKGGARARPTLAELRARWRAAVSLPALPPDVLPPPPVDAAADVELLGPFRVSDASNLRTDGRHITIVTTAALPWMTGTSINPLLRAAYLAERSGRRQVTLVVPWLAPDEQHYVFPASLRFQSPAEQEEYIRWWGETKGSLPNLDFEIAWYPAGFDEVAGSIMPTTDLVRQLPAGCDDVAILEEPEHLTWNHHGTRWNRHFRHVVGVAHTNYIAYAEQFGASTMAGSWFINTLCVAAYCDVTIKLSDTLQWLPGRCIVRNVHGVRPDFLAIGARRAVEPPPARASDGIYFLGKALWAKGYRQLLELTDSEAWRAQLGGVRVDCYGYGPDDEDIRAEAAARGSPTDFLGAIDHADESINAYDVFVNPSTSEVLCTATAEALAMGKVVVIAEHPSNNFFKSFANARFFRTPAQFAKQVRDALESTPQPLSAVERYTLSWEAAIERLLDAAALPESATRQVDHPLHKAAYSVHFAMGLPWWGDYLRAYSNAVPWKPYDGYHTPDRVLASASVAVDEAHEQPEPHATDASIGAVGTESEHEHEHSQPATWEHSRSKQ